MRPAVLLAGAAAWLLIAAAPASPDPALLDKDERGLWMQAEEYERQLVNSNFLIRDPALNAYVRGVFCKTVGEEECKPVRIYLMRTPYFNASMAPNGMMQLWSGLFLRVRNEAQLAAVLAHEFRHYQEHHSVKMLREMKKKTDAMTWLAFLPFGWVASLGVAGSMFSYSRDMERDADAASVQLIANVGYDPHAASRIWEQARAEMDATALARGKKSRKDKDRGMFTTHPPSAERMTALAALADKHPIKDGRTNRDEYRAALQPWWQAFVDDQIKVNDFGGTDMLLTELAREGWSSELLFARGELYRSRGRPEDLIKAAGFYREAIAGTNAPVEAYRGLGLSLLRSGANAEGQAALRDYLSKKPDATDRAMITALAGGV